MLKLAVVYGRGIQSYMNDGGADIGVEIDPAEPAGIKGVALPITLLSYVLATMD